MVLISLFRMTRRDKIIQELEKESKSIDALAVFFECSVSDIISDLEHIQRSLKRRGKKLLVLQPRCRSCGEVIKIKKPKNIKKCPVCRSTFIYPAKFKIEASI